MITDTLKELNSDGRQLMSQMNKIGLGIWRGGEIDLVKYDPKAYDRNGIQSTNIVDYNDSECGDIDENGYDSGDCDGNKNDDYDHM